MEAGALRTKLGARMAWTDRVQELARFADEVSNVKDEVDLTLKDPNLSPKERSVLLRLLEGRAQKDAASAIGSAAVAGIATVISAVTLLPSGGIAVLVPLALAGVTMLCAKNISPALAAARYADEKAGTIRVLQAPEK